MFRNRYNNSDTASKPAIIEGAHQFLEYIEIRTSPSAMRVSDWIEVPRNKLTTPEQITKDAAGRLLQAWLLGNIEIPFEQNEQIPPRASSALKILHQYAVASHGCAPTGCCSSGIQEEKVLDSAEEKVLSSALELLRNWFTGEIELRAVVPRKRFRFTASEQTRMKTVKPAI